VRITLGPKSKSVLIQKQWGAPIVCDDGVTIAMESELADPEENLGARMLRQAAEQTGDAVGDGTSTLEAGIVDPVKVVRTALENAVSVASVLMLTEATMTEKPEKRHEHSAAETEV
jgi:chaperonin GroEL (HSP60 family)